MRRALLLDLLPSLPREAKGVRIVVLSPEAPEPVEVKHVIRHGRVQFALPKFLVYAVARVQLAAE
jgi:hypothetical protein